MIANLNEGPERELAVGHIRSTWRDLGRQVGSQGIGMRRIVTEEGGFTTPAHEHGVEEEIFFVLAGEGLLWQEGETFDVRAGDCIVHRPKSGAHTLRGGAGGLDVLVFGQRNDGSLTAVPRAGIAWSFPRWVGLAGGEHPFAREAAAGPPECGEPNPERPPHVVALADVEGARGGRVRALAASAGAQASGLNHVTLNAGESGAPAHCHSLEEELFAVLAGDGVLELRAGGAEQPQEHSLRAGDVFSRPPGSGVAHSLRAGEEELTYLAYGTREPGDMSFYPQLARVSFRGLGIALSSPQIEYL